MRLPLRRKGARRAGAADEHDPAPVADHGAMPHAKQAPARPAARAWPSFGALRPTAAPVAPILAPLGLPELASTRSMIHRVRSETGAPPLGVVQGIAAVLPPGEPAISPGPGSDQGSVVPHPDPAPVRPSGTAVASRPSVSASALTHVTAPFVGEPREPAVPHRAPGWLRAVMPAGESGLVATPLDAIASPAPSARSWTAPALAPEPRPSAAPVPAAPSAPLRRPRRPGLGAPLAAADVIAMRQRALEADAEPYPTPEAEAETPEPAPRPREVVEPLPAASVPRAPADLTPTTAARFTATIAPDLADPAAAFQAAQGSGDLAYHRTVLRRFRGDGAETTIDPAPADSDQAGVLGHRSAAGRFANSEVAPDPTAPGSYGVPADLAATFQRSHGVDVSAVPVDRGPHGAAEARRIGARAFSRGELIVLPSEAGPGDAADARALLGHELAHVVQQRLLGSVPPETDESGRALEEAAQATEAWIRGGAAGPPPPILPSAPLPLWRQAAPAYRPAQGSHSPPPAQPSRGPLSRPGPGPVSGSVQRAPAGAVASTRPTVTAAAPVRDQEPPQLVHPAAVTAPTRSESTFPRTEDELNRAIASGALDVFREQQRSTQPVPQSVQPSEYDRERRRAELSAALLERANAQRAERGEAPLRTLPAELSVLVETTLDEEQAAAAPFPSETSASSAADAHRPSAGGSASGPRPGPGSPAAGSPGSRATGGSPPIGVGQPGQHGFAVSGYGGPASPAAGSAAGPTPGPAPVPEPAWPQQQPQQQPQPSAEPTPAPQPAASADAQLVVGTADLSDEQVARLYERIKTRLRRELLVDRERSGQLMDFR